MRTDESTTPRRAKKLNIGFLSVVDVPAHEGADVKVIKTRARVAKADEPKTKTEDGVAYPASDFAYVPDPQKPSEWKLRLTSTPGGEPDPAIVGAAAAALGPGYRGNKVELPADAREAVVETVRAAWRKANPDESFDDMPEGIKVEKVEMSKDTADVQADDDVKVVAKSVFSTELKRRKLSESLDHAFDAMWSMNNALRESVDRIAKDEAITDKEAAMAASIGEYVDAIAEIFSQPVKKVAKDDDNAQSAEVTKAADESFDDADGVTVVKSAVGEAAFKMLKAANAKRVEAEEALHMEKLTKRAADELGNLTGEVVAKARVLKCIDRMPEAERDLLQRMLKSANESAASAFNPVAVANSDVLPDDPNERIDALVNKHMAEHKVSKSVALAAVMRTEEGKQLYREASNGN